MPSEVIVPVLEASRSILDPKQFLVLTSQQIEGLLCVFRISCPRVLQHLDHEDGHLHTGGPQMWSHFGGNKRAHLEQFQIDQFLVLPHALQLREGIVGRRHGDDHGAYHALHVFEQVRATVNGVILRVTAHALAVEGDLHFSERRVTVDILTHDVFEAA